MSTTRVLVRNICSNWAGFAVQIAVAFFLTPFVLHKLGDVRYGVWILITGLTGYYGLLDLGFRAGLTQYLARYLAVRDFERMNRTASTGFVVLAACGLLLLAVSLVMAAVAPRIFDIAPDLVEEVQWGIVIVGGAFAIQFLFFPISAVFSATQRYDLANAIGISTRLLAAALTYVLLSRGHGLIALAAVTAGTNLAGYLVRWPLAHWILPELHISPRLACLATLGDLASFGMWNVAIVGSTQIISYTHAVLIALFVSPIAVTRFALAANLCDYFSRMFVPISTVFFPAFTQMDAEGDSEKIRRVYLAATRMLTLVAFCVGLIAWFWADDFYRLWVGESYTSSNGLPAVSALFRVLLAAGVITSIQRVGYQVLLGSRQVRTLALMFLAEAVCNLVLSLVLLRAIGLMGVAIGTLLPAALFQGFVHPVVVGRWLDLGPVRYLREIYMRPLLVAAVLIPALLAIRTLPPASTWLELGGQGLLAVTAAGVAVLALGVNEQERMRFVRRPLARVRETLAASL